MFFIKKKKNDRSQSRFRDLEPAQTHGGVASMFDDSLQGGRKSLSHRSYCSSSYRDCKNRSTCMCIILANKSTSRDPVDGNSCLL